MSRPKRSVRWMVTHGSAGSLTAPCWWSSSLRKWLTHEEGRASGHGWSNCAFALTRRQAERIAARMTDPSCARLTMLCYRKSRRHPQGFTRTYGACTHVTCTSCVQPMRDTNRKEAT